MATQSRQSVTLEIDGRNAGLQLVEEALFSCGRIGTRAVHFTIHNTKKDGDGRRGGVVVESACMCVIALYIPCIGQYTFRNKSRNCS
jgi:hypothetical protein